MAQPSPDVRVGHGWAVTCRGREADRPGSAPGGGWAQTATLGSSGPRCRGGLRFPAAAR
ncbi:protein of unknown function [Kyrpidia spormannii]|uniref:Uncharacterized protein n=2 Tax=Kyrpidia spormannii TaxID=2055160 RepID=A0ACA8ZDW3_9BACL|nr:protein of unknown function [Kyrpidia spormannii]CAB3396188.1 protein of unknown function [Kyrpidia spormannii]